MNSIDYYASAKNPVNHRDSGISGDLKRQYETNQRDGILATPPTILVVDDLPTNVELMEALLTPVGYHVLTAYSGEEALEIVMQDAPDLILLDLMMPEMDGFEVLRRLRSIPDLPYIPTILLTGVQEHSARIKGLEMGADDFLNKPVAFPELSARVKSLLRLKRAYTDLEHTAQENARLANLLNEENIRLAQELEQTRASQMRLLPHTGPDYSGVTFSAYYSPAREVGGDYYDHFRVDDHRFVVVVGDAVGKGGAAVLQVSIIKSLLAAEFDHIALQSREQRDPSPANILARLNRLVCSALPSSGLEMTLACVLFDLNQQTITYASAGHPFPFLLRNGQVMALQQRGLPVGLFDEAQYNESQLELRSGDRLVLYSDGIIERLNAKGALFQLEGLKAALENVDPTHSNPFDIQTQVLEAMHSFAANVPQNDDETLVILEIEAAIG